MVDSKLNGKIAEEIVLQMLKKEGKKVIDNRKKPREIGDFQVGNKIIEVKGHIEDHTGDESDNFDFVARYISLSAQEWKFLRKSPKLFEVYIVYRLNEKKYPKHPKWNFPKVICIKGTEIVDAEKDRPIVRVKTLKPFWSDKGKRQHRVSTSIFNKAKKKIKK